MLEKRLIKNLQRLKGWLKDQNIKAFRLYEKDIPEIPYIIDIYTPESKTLAVVYEKGNAEATQDKTESNYQEIEKSLKNIFENPEVIFKQRMQQRNKTEYQRSKFSENVYFITENDLKFEINPYSYIDTGIFLDHRPLRKTVRNILKNHPHSRLLNLFSYTCSFGVYGASVGAKTVNVDLSKNYLTWGRKNYTHNQISINDHDFIAKDIFEFLREALPNGENPQDPFDIIILDPPSFSNSKKMDYSFNVQDHHGKMIRNILPLMKPDGIIYFSGNLRNFKLDLEKDLEECLEIKDISKKTIPIDFRDQKIHFCFEMRKL